MQRGKNPSNKYRGIMSHETGVGNGQTDGRPENIMPLPPTVGGGSIENVEVQKMTTNTTCAKHVKNRFRV